MEDKKPEENAHNPEVDHLFAEMDNIAASGQTETLQFEVEDLLLDRETARAERDTISSLIAYLPDSHIGIRVLDEFARNEPDTPLMYIANRLSRNLRHHPDGLSDIDWLLLNKATELALNISEITDASRVDVDDLEKDLLPTKREIQTRILESTVHSSEDKQALIQFVEERVEGKGIDLGDADDVARAFSESISRDEAYDSEKAERAKTKIVLKNEFSQYGLQENDPLYKHFLFLLGAYITGGSNTEEVVQIGLHKNFDLLGIKEGDLRQSIQTIVDKLK